MERESGISIINLICLAGAVVSVTVLGYFIFKKLLVLLLKLLYDLFIRLR